MSIHPPKDNVNHLTGIRPFQPADTDELIDTWYAASRLAHPFLDDGFFEKERVAIRDIYLPHTRSWVYLEGGRLIGFISMMDNEIGALFVRPEFQKRGIGRRLMNVVNEMHDSLEVEVFRDNNIGRAFYRKYGFQLIREYTFASTGHRMQRLRYSDHQ